MSDPNKDLDGFAPGDRPLCVFCNAPWTDGMMAIYADAELETGYYGDSSLSHIDVAVEIECEKCERLIYRKEIRTSGGEWVFGDKA